MPPEKVIWGLVAALAVILGAEWAEAYGVAVVAFLASLDCIVNPRVASRDKEQS